MSMTAQIAPSILSADFTNLERDLGKIATADWAHVDVMDNHFVPNLTIGLPVVERIRQVSPVPIDVHLMIEDPDRWAPGFAEVGAQSVTFHAEAATAPVRLARELRRLGARAGMALRPATPVEHDRGAGLWRAVVHRGDAPQDSACSQGAQRTEP
jgi:ribulose-phosphate 3-epimerase